MERDAIWSERGMSAPAEVVFNTATDPARLATWLPAPLRRHSCRAAVRDSVMRASWGGDSRGGWSAGLEVRQADAGGARVRLELLADLPEHRLAEIADRSLADLARHVADNLTAS